MLALVVDGCAEAGSAQRRFVPGCRRATTHAGSRRNHRCRRRAPSALFRPRFGRVVVGRRQGARSGTRDRPSEPTAAALLAELQSEWLSLQATITDGASELIRKGQALQRVVGDVERAVERDSLLHPSAENYAGRLEDGSAADYDGGRNFEATATGRYHPAIGARAASFAKNRRPFARGRLQARGKRSLRSRRWAGLLAALIGVGIAVLVVFALQQLQPSSTSTLTEETTEPTSVPLPTTPPDREHCAGS